MGIIAFSIGNFNVYWYGLMMSMAIFFAILITSLNLYFRCKSTNHMMEIFSCIIVFAIIFARIGYVILHPDIYQNNLVEIFALHHGGLSIYGAFLGYLLALSIYTYSKKLDFWYWLDILAPAMVFCIIIVQISNFSLQATVGLPVMANEAANSRIIEYIEYSFRPIGVKEFEYFKPVALYQAIWQSLVFIFISVISFKAKRLNIRKGNIFLLAIILVCVGRILLGYMYLGAEGIWNLHFSQLMCLGIIITAGLLMIWKNIYINKNIKQQIFH